MSAKWVLLADPKDYGWTELEADGKAVWDGIRNARAQSNIRKMKKGDQALIYHTAPDKAIVGIAKIASAPRPDPADDERSVVDVEPVRALKRPIPIAELREDDVLSTMSFIRMPRVAVWPVTDDQWARVLEVGRG